MRRSVITGAFFGCVGMGVLDLLVLNLFVLPTLHDDAVTIASAPRLVPAELVDARERTIQREPEPEPQPVAGHEQAAVEHTAGHESSLSAALAPQELEPIPTDAPAVVTVTFDVSSPRVTRAAQRALVASLDALGTAGHLVLVGHADATGPEEFNERLSWDRARAVAKRLTMLGVAPSRLQIEARGAREPSRTGSDRRVEVYLGDEP